jgi:hypothetical protein
VSALIFCTMASGVPGGTTRANQALEMRSGRPISDAFGTSGATGLRVRLATPRNFNCLAFSKRSAAEMLPMKMSTRPAVRSISAGPSPL